MVSIYIIAFRLRMVLKCGTSI